MSILIKGMEMPKSCGDCRFCGGIADTDCGPCAWCDVDGKARVADTRQDCPLVPVPEPHGRLIEKGKTLDACYTHFEDYMNGKIDGKTALLNIEKEIKAAPTIIPASEEGE